MATYTLNQYHKVWKARAKRIKTAGIKSSSEAGNFMIASAKGMVPRYTHETLQGIGKEKTKDGYDVVSRVPAKGKTGFRQNLWTNQNVPYRTPHMYWNTDKDGNPLPTLYGDGSHKTSGTPQWFHLATVRTKDEFPKIVRRNTTKALRVGF